MTRAALLTAGLCTGLLALATAGVAGADEPRYPMKAAQTVRAGQFVSASGIGSVANGEMVEIQCQDVGDSVGGSTLWDFIQYDVDGQPGMTKSGWVPDYYVKTGVTGALSAVKQGGCPAPQVQPGPPRPRPAVTAPAPVAPAPTTTVPAPAPVIPPAALPTPRRGPAKVALSSSHRRLRNGRTVRLRGHLVSGPRLKGVLVELQAWRGTYWQTFGTARTGKAGTYHYRYRFTRTLGTVRYRFRARVPAQLGYPYRTGGSRSVHVTVKG